MSLYRAKIIYNDGKELFVDIKQEELKDFSKHISEQQIYWNKTETQGFWTDINQIRYINFIKVNEEIIDESETKSVPNDTKEIPAEDD